MAEDVEALRALLGRVEACAGPDRDLDGLLWWHFADHSTTDDDILERAESRGVPYALSYFLGREWAQRTDSRAYSAVPGYTVSIDAAVAAVERCLPGWWWRCGTCSVSDDACIAPDFNSLEHGERLKAELLPPTAGKEFDPRFDEGFDVDRRPPGNVPLALIEALLRALIARAEAADIPAPHDGSAT